MTEESTSTTAKPFLRVVSGNPSAEELAAVVTVLAAAAASTTTDEPADDGIHWGSPANMHRIPIVAPGPGTWMQLGRRQ